MNVASKNSNNAADHTYFTDGYSSLDATERRKRIQKTTTTIHFGFTIMNLILLPGDWES